MGGDSDLSSAESTYTISVSGSPPPSRPGSPILRSVKLEEAEIDLGAGELSDDDDDDAVPRPRPLEIWERPEFLADLAADASARAMELLQLQADRLRMDDGVYELQTHLARPRPYESYYDESMFLGMTQRDRETAKQKQERKEAEAAGGEAKWKGRGAEGKLREMDRSEMSRKMRAGVGKGKVWIADRYVQFGSVEDDDSLLMSAETRRKKHHAFMDLPIHARVSPSSPSFSFLSQLYLSHTLTIILSPSLSLSQRAIIDGEDPNYPFVDPDSIVLDADGNVIIFAEKMPPGARSLLEDKIAPLLVRLHQLELYMGSNSRENRHVGARSDCRSVLFFPFSPLTSCTRLTFSSVISSLYQ